MSLIGSGSPELDYNKRRLLYISRPGSILYALLLAIQEANARAYGIQGVMKPTDLICHRTEVMVVRKSNQILISSICLISSPLQNGGSPLLPLFFRQLLVPVALPREEHKGGTREDPPKAA